MSSIPASAMHHAKAHPDHDPAADPVETVPPARDRSDPVHDDKPGRVFAAVKAHPIAAAAVGATVVAGAVAAVAAPLLRDTKLKAKPKTARKPAKKAPKKKAD